MAARRANTEVHGDVPVDDRPSRESAIGRVDGDVVSEQGHAAVPTLSRRALLTGGVAVVAGACTSACMRASSSSRVVGVDAGAPAGEIPGALSLDALDTEIARWMRMASVPGLSIALVRRDGGAATLKGDGVRRAGGTGAAADTQEISAAAVTPDTVFEAASLTKPVFAYVVLRLAAEGALDLDRPLGAYVPLPNASDERAKAITARHVLSHSGGWRNWRGGQDVTLTADFTPGSRFSYSGEGYFFLQRVVERVTNRGLLALVRERVFEPLGMRSSGFLWTPALDAALAAPHTNRGQPLDSHGARIGRGFHGITDFGRPVAEWTTEDAERALPRVDANLPVLPNFLVPNAAASLMTTARDYAAFLGHLLGAPGTPSGGRAIFERMMPPQVTINEALSWGLGIGVESHEGREYAWHWGDNPGFKNILLFEPARAMVVFTNGNNGMRVYERIVRAVTGVDHPAFLWV